MMGQRDRQVPLWNYRVNLNKRCAMITATTTQRGVRSDLCRSSGSPHLRPSLGTEERQAFGAALEASLVRLVAARQRDYGRQKQPTGRGPEAGRAQERVPTHFYRNESHAVSRTGYRHCCRVGRMP